MMNKFINYIENELASLAAEKLLRGEIVLASAQGSDIQVGNDAQLNLCANNYLGLANDARIVEASIAATRQWGAGYASVRFICGTSALHKELEAKTATFLGYEDCITFAAAFDANGGVFEALFGAEDAIVSDALNHASIIDGIRLSKARRYRFANGDLADLETQLKAAQAGGARHIVIVTDGVFSMDGYLAKLPQISALAKNFGALLLVDDCHSTGVLGNGGRGTADHLGVAGCVDILIGTYGKALGGAMGGFICAAAPVVQLLRERARPYLFSNALAPAVCGAAIAAIDLCHSAEGNILRARLHANALQFRQGLSVAGFHLLAGDHPIIPVMLGEADVAVRLAAALLEQGIYVRAFSYPVVPKGQARIRTQMSAALSLEQISRAISAFADAGRATGVIT
jgi:glycine C-acetyltransferase